MRRLRLAVADRVDARADNLGDKGAGIDGQPEQQGEEFRL